MPIFGFIVFIVVFGWEGPATLYAGIQSGDKVFIVLGLFLTLFFWGTFGIAHLQDVYEYVRGKGRG
jgi:Mn2+/Fe2+ NRAMP family transporter